MPSRKSSKPEQIALGFDPEVMLVAGVDEAGRGPLAGPVVAAAVILDDCRRIRGLADSKVLPPARRERLFDEIRAKALAFCIAEASVDEIDTLNILQATLLAMKRAVEGLRLPPHKVLVDGNQLPRLRVRCEAIVGGDARVKSISAASILAKVARDQICREHEERYPLYGFAVHKGYGTPQHLAALTAHGPCPWHRRSFAPVREAELQRWGNAIEPGTSPADDRPGLEAQAQAQAQAKAPTQVQVSMPTQAQAQSTPS